MPLKVKGEPRRQPVPHGLAGKVDWDDPLNTFHFGTVRRDGQVARRASDAARTAEEKRVERAEAKHSRKRGARVVQRIAKRYPKLGRKQ